jgi:DUF218 domain
MVWPNGCVCHAVRAPGVKCTIAAPTREGPAGVATVSMKTVPVNQSPCPLAVSRELRVICMSLLCQLRDPLQALPAIRHSARSIVTSKSSLWPSIASSSPSNSPIRTMPLKYGASYVPEVERNWETLPVPGLAGSVTGWDRAWLGPAGVSGGRSTPALRERLLAAADLVRAGRVPRLVLSGGPEKVAVMRAELAGLGLDPRALVSDPAGTSTLASVRNAATRPGLRSVTVVTQRFHIARALWLARRHGLRAHGLVADGRVPYAPRDGGVREILARAKAVGSVALGT